MQAWLKTQYLRKNSMVSFAAKNFDPAPSFLGAYVFKMRCKIEKNSGQMFLVNIRGDTSMTKM